MNADDLGVVVDVYTTVRPEPGVGVTPVLDRGESLALRVGELPRHPAERDHAHGRHLDESDRCIVVVDQGEPLADALEFLTLALVLRQQARGRGLGALEDEAFRSARMSPGVPRPRVRGSFTRGHLRTTVLMPGQVRSTGQSSHGAVSSILA
jgi:hypothetical protein